MLEGGRNNSLSMLDTGKTRNNKLGLGQQRFRLDIGARCIFDFPEARKVRHQIDCFARLKSLALQLPPSGIYLLQGYHRWKWTCPGGCMTWDLPARTVLSFSVIPSERRLKVTWMHQSLKLLFSIALLWKVTEPSIQKPASHACGQRREWYPMLTRRGMAGQPFCTQVPELGSLWCSASLRHTGFEAASGSRRTRRKRWITTRADVRGKGWADCPAGSAS